MDTNYFLTYSKYMTGKMPAPEPEVLEKELAIIQLRKTGATWEKIGRALGYAGASGAYKAYQRAAERMVHPTLNEYRDIELELLDEIQFQLFHDEEGKPKKRLTLREMDRALAVSDRRARIVGLNAPEKIQAEVITNDDNGIVEHTRNLIQLIAAVREAQARMGDGTGETRAITG